MALSLALHQLAGTHWSRRAPALRSQLLRAAASIPANVAEGAGQNSDARFANFLSIAIGSANELESHLALAVGLGLLEQRTHDELVAQLSEVRRMLSGLRTRLGAGR